MGTKFKMFLYRKRRAIFRELYKKKLKSLIGQLKPYNTNYELIRLGASRDGGYLVPNDLDNIKACFSAGVGDECSFEFDCANLGMDVYMADASVESPPIKDSRFNFLNKFLDYFDSEKTIKLKSWLDINGIRKGNDCILQMDIEGDEYKVLGSITQKQLSNFRIIIIEFHHLNKLSDSSFFKELNSVFQEILKNHICVHIHPNNCCGIQVIEGIEIPRVAEFTFIRKDRVQTIRGANRFPHPLDCDNVKKPSISLPKIWYQ